MSWCQVRRAPIGFYILIIGVMIALGVSQPGTVFARGVNQLAPEKPEQVELPFVAQAGDRYRVIDEERKLKRISGKMTVVEAKRVEYDAEILSLHDDGYEVQWTLRSASVENPSDSSLQAKVRTTLGQQILVAFQDKPYVFLSDWAGRPVRVPNWRTYADQAEAAMEENLPKVFGELVGDKANTPQVQNIIKGTIQSLKNMFATQDEKSVANLYEVERILASAQHLALPRAVWVDWAHSAPVFGNQGEIDSFTNVRLSKLDRDADLAEIEWRTSFDDKQLSSTVAAIVRRQVEALKLPEAQSKPILQALDKGIAVERVDKGLAKLRISDGWAFEVHYEKRIENKTAGFKRLDEEKRTITVKRLPAN